MMKTKSCKRCGETKAAEAFYRNKRTANGLTYWCGACCSRYGVERLNRSTPQAERARRLKKESHARSVRELRRQVIEAYGGLCACCGERTPEFLSVDHVNGDGAQHRRDIKGPLYRWLKANKFPQEGFRLLCFNCNCAKGFFGACPHERARDLTHAA